MKNGCNIPYPIIVDIYYRRQVPERSKILDITDSKDRLTLREFNDLSLSFTKELGTRHFYNLQFAATICSFVKDSLYHNIPSHWTPLGPLRRVNKYRIR